MTMLCRLMLELKRTLVPVTKVTGKRRQDTDDNLEQHDVQASGEVAGTGASSTGASSSTVYPEETWLHKHQADTREGRVSTRTRIGQQMN